MNVLVTGFGPFLDVVHNPSGVLAREVDGLQIRGARLHGLELPVTWECARQVVDRARAIDARIVVGLGVDRNSASVDVETRGYNLAEGVDALGTRGPRALSEGGPNLVHATVDARALAVALGGRVDDDAGRYVCNAWLYGVVRGLPDRQVVFVHVPRGGMAVERLVQGLAVLVPR